MDIPFDDVAGVIPNREGRVVDVDGEHLPGVYATGWIKRGPVGLIGHTKSDASETIRHLGEDVAEGGEAFYTATDRDPEAVTEFLHGRGVDVITWQGWELLDAYERSLGEPHGRERVKLVPRDEMVRSSLRPRRLTTATRPSEDAAAPALTSSDVGYGPVMRRRNSRVRSSRGFAEHLRGRAALVHAALVQEADLVGDLAREAHLVGGDDHRQPGLLELGQQREDLADELGVERAGHLVEQHHGGLADEGAGDRDALLLAAGELVGEGLRLGGQPDPVEHGERLGLGPARATSCAPAAGRASRCRSRAGAGTGCTPGTPCRSGRGPRWRRAAGR